MALKSHKYGTSVLSMGRGYRPPSYADLRMTREQGQADLTVFEMRIYLDHSELIPGLSMEIVHE